MGIAVFASDSYILRPPAAISLKTRLCLEAIAFSIRAIMGALGTIQRIVGAHAENPASISDEERIDLFLSAWAIIDQIHMLRKLLTQIDDPKREPNYVKLFQVRYNNATMIRNKMDHLTTNLRNAAASKKRTANIFGSISYMITDAVPTEDAPGWCRLVAVPFGSLMASNQSIDVRIHEPPAEAGISYLKFSAFGIELPIYGIGQDITNLVTYLEKDVMRFVENGLARLEAAGKNVEGARYQPPSGLVMALRFHFNKQSFNFD